MPELPPLPWHFTVRRLLWAAMPQATGRAVVGEDRSVLTRPAPPPPLHLRHGDGAAHVADGWPGDERAARRPLLLLIHGGFWRPEYDREHTRPLAAALRGAGWTAASVEYRREPGDPHATTADVRAALDRLPGELAAAGAPFDGRILLVGHSAGGHLALWAAAAHPPDGLAGTLALAPVADLRLAHRLGLDDGAVADFLGGPPDDAAALDPVRLPAPTTPVALAHGTDDIRVPPALSTAYTTAHPTARLLPLQNTGHFELIDPLSTAWPTLLTTLKSLAAPST
ncbi:alpha/beta hydrolase family protein [Streptomyces johnsoniae]|uniref:Alpha/beta hydrolase n=1 Tax=Streptomyces johnsoniae TaxID=3075532 RepID=A0ABU2SCY9_9ACTN|nr:alpha/beta hydrolase [Streptomyces sp. DSM 41886]MDT0446673.1 alpha/beta hydrolase [Streptomyces sp. DSM 41886]